MSRNLSLLALIILLFCACSSLTQAKWETVNGDGFTVQMPGTPNKQTQSVPSAVGTLTFNMYTVEQGGEAFIVGYNDFPAAATQGANPDDLLNRAQQGAVTNVNGKITSEKTITMNGHPGREFSGDGTPPGEGGKSQEGTFTARIYWVEPRLYQTIYVRPKGNTSSDNGGKFLDSFQLTGK